MEGGGFREDLHSSNARYVEIYFDKEVHRVCSCCNSDLRRRVRLPRMESRSRALIELSIMASPVCTIANRKVERGGSGVFQRLRRAGIRRLCPRGGHPKQPLPKIGLRDPLHCRRACPDINSFHQGVGKICSQEGLFSCRPLPKRR